MIAILSEENTKLNIVRFARRNTAFLIENNAFIHISKLNREFDPLHPNHYSEVVGIPGPWFLYSESGPLYDLTNVSVKDVYSRPLLQGTVLYQDEEAFVEDMRSMLPMALPQYYNFRTTIFPQRL